MTGLLLRCVPFFLSGAVFGLSGGLAPGPTTTLVIVQTVRHSAREGFKVAAAPLITDGPIVFATVVGLLAVPRRDSVLAVISLMGAAFLFALGALSLRAPPLRLEVDAGAPRSLALGVMANFLNPHPYLFWITIGAPTVVKALTVHWLAAVVFVTTHYAGLVGAKVGVALLVHRARGFLRGRGYQVTMRLLGVALIVFGVVFLRDGLRLWGG